ncbi:MAG: DUF1801 domain-containing protein [Micropruina sp.]
MAERVTIPSSRSVEDVLAEVADPRRREDARDVTALMARVTGAEPSVWGDSVIGFGRMPYKTADGVPHEWFAVGLAARKAALTLYGLIDYGSNGDLLEALGPHTVGKGCLYLKRLSAVDSTVLTELVERAWTANHQAAES